jgi:thiamine pyrophosphate-dependent acetolactate synthase large subunit-like protein
MTTEKKERQTAGQLLVRSLVNQEVKFIFGIPGGKIMPTFDVLNDEGPSIIHVGDYPCDIDNYYQPEIELQGSVEDTLDDLALQLNERSLTIDAELQGIQAEFRALQNPVAPPLGELTHPLLAYHGLWREQSFIPARRW